MTNDLTTTSYAILGLLSLRSWTSYELAEQMKRALGLFWPRAESGIYREPKKLEAHGLAHSTTEHVGERPRTRYTITAKGRRALAAWVPTPGEGPVVEFEQLVKVFFAEQATKADLLATLAGVQAWAEDQVRRDARHPAGVPRGSGRLPGASAVADPRGEVPPRHPGGGRRVGGVGDRRRGGVARRPEPGRARP